MLKIPTWEIKKIQEHAKRDYPKECCGVVVGKPNEAFVCYTEPLRNIEKNHPEKNFKVDPQEQLVLQKKGIEEGLGVLGYYHSHPDGTPRPSRTDLEMAWENLIYVIIAVNKDKETSVNIYELDDGKKQFKEVPFEEYPK